METNDGQYVSNLVTFHNKNEFLSPADGRRGIPISKLYRYVPLWGVWFFRQWVLDIVKKSDSFGLE